MNDSSTRHGGRAVAIGQRRLDGMLSVPPNAGGLVIFAHGSGSSRLSPRNARVAGALNEHGLATLLFDLLDDAEAADRRNLFDIPLLGRRVAEAVEWARRDATVAALPLGLFGASTGAAAALVAAAQHRDEVAAIVSRGGRPDLASDVLARVRAPTLLIVGGADREVLRLNERALAALSCEHRLHVVTGATHLFGEPGALDEVVTVAADWFTTRLAGARA